MKNRTKKNREIKTALRQLAALYNHINENRDLLFLEPKDEKIQAS